MKSSLKKAQKRYQVNTKKTYLICLNRKKDKKIIAYIDRLDNKSEYFRKKVLEDMKNGS